VKSLVDLLLGRPLKSSEESREKVGPAAGIAIFGLDALGSASYGPEAALTLLIPLGASALNYILPISASIVALLLIVYFSYRQTIEAYPTGGGSYTVASQNLGVVPGLLAATALMIDYLLTAAVGISAGVGALISALPVVQPYTLSLCLAILLIVTIVNLRGVRDTGLVFLLPTYLFVGTLFITLGLGLFKAFAAGGEPHPVVPPPPLAPPATAMVGTWLLLKAFSSGCTAMTGVEAVSNGVQAFREPVVKTAQRTLTYIVAILALLLAGIAYLVGVYHIGATPPGEPGYESVLSQLTGAVAGKGIFYYVTISSILLVLAFQANTAFADFPRICRAVAHDGYLPYSFASRGRRLVYTQGIVVLAILCAVLLTFFGGVTDHLIPLFAVGALLAFTLSQVGMVAHWRRVGGRHASASMLVNGLGAAATATTVLVVTVSKFAEGAWLTTLFIAAIMILMISIRRHYDREQIEIASPLAVDLSHLRRPLAVVPIRRWDKLAEKGLRFALLLSPDVQALHVDIGEGSRELRENWRRFVEEPAKKAAFTTPKLVVLESPYRYVIEPIMNYVLELEDKNPDRQIAVLVPELVVRHWYQYLLHNQRAAWLKSLLLLKGNQRIVVIDVPWYLSSPRQNLSLDGSKASSDAETQRHLRFIRSIAAGK
jgi:amino acid transporter